jgi:hypothetical protein
MPNRLVEARNVSVFILSLMRNIMATAKLRAHAA